jgi:IS5 family transposase
MAYHRYEQYDIFQQVFQEPLHRDHELMVLGDRIEWDAITDRLLVYYSRRGRQAKRIRLMVGLHILKHRFDLSDEEVVKGVHENVYWMAFCGVKLQAWYMDDGAGRVQPCCFLESSTMTKFRRRLGAEGIKRLEEAIRDILISERHICPRAQFVDTTAQPKHIEYPTDSGLLHRGRQRLVRTIRRLQRQGVEVSAGIRSFARLSNKAVIEINKLGKDRKARIEAGLGKLLSYAHHVLRRVPQVLQRAERKMEELLQQGQEQAAQRLARLKRQLEADTELVKRVIHQTKQRLRGVHAPGKLYSLHEPHVACIRKGKRSRPDEYGTKVVLSMDRHGYVVDHREYAGNPGDASLLDEACHRWEGIFGAAAKELGADRGFHGHAHLPTIHLEKIRRISIPPRGKKPHPEGKACWFKRLQRQRTKMEPRIGHLKTDHGFDRCRYKGFEGDQMNASLATIAWNLRKWGKQLLAQAT